MIPSPHPSDTLLDAYRLQRNFGPVVAVADVSLSVARGEVLGLLGVNGAGKSTTMDLLCGVLAPAAGDIRVCGIDLRRAPRQAKRELGYLPETPPLYPELTTRENLDFSGRIHGLRGAALRRACDGVLERCLLGDVATRLAGNLSKGFRQRLGLALALLHDPAVLVLDEPSAGLDPLQLREFRTLIESLAHERAVVLSTHILHEVTALCTRVLILHQGRVAHESALADIDAANPRLRLHCHREPDPAMIGALAGVTAVARAGSGIVHVGTDAVHDPAPALARLALEQDWGLLELAREHSALEQAFVAITCGESTA